MGGCFGWYAEKQQEDHHFGGSNQRHPRWFGRRKSKAHTPDFFKVESHKYTPHHYESKPHAGVNGRITTFQEAGDTSPNTTPNHPPVPRLVLHGAVQQGSLQ